MKTVYSPVNYYTYNLQNYYACSGASILFALFYYILLNMLKYELYNKRGFCDPAFYYGQACRNQISDSILLDPTFVQSKNAYYKNVQDSIDPKMHLDKRVIKESGDFIHGSIKENVTFIESTIVNIKEITTTIKDISAKYLGNLQGFLNSTQNQSTATWQQIQNIPPLLATLQSQINEAVITPSMARYVAPLQKLYDSLSDINPENI